jgi:hypothetical protein
MECCACVAQARTATYSNLFRSFDPDPQKPMENRKSASQVVRFARKKRDTPCIGRETARSVLFRHFAFAICHFAFRRPLFLNRIPPTALPNWQWTKVEQDGTRSTQFVRANLSTFVAISKLNHREPEVARANLSTFLPFVP